MYSVDLNPYRMRSRAASAALLLSSRRSTLMLSASAVFSQVVETCGAAFFKHKQPHDLVVVKVS